MISVSVVVVVIVCRYAVLLITGLCLQRLARPPSDTIPNSVEVSSRYIVMNFLLVIGIYRASAQRNAPVFPPYKKILIRQCHVLAAQLRIVPAQSHLTVVPGGWYHTASASPLLREGPWPMARTLQHMEYFTHSRYLPCCQCTETCSNYTNPGYGLSLVDTLWNAGLYRQPLEQEGNPMT